MQDKIQKLPKWAQDHIRNISRQRSEAIKALNDYTDNQTKSPFYSEHLLCLGEEGKNSFKKIYFQAYQMTVEHAGIKVNIYTSRDDSIEINYSGEGYSLENICLIPDSYQRIRLITKDNMS